MRAEDLFEAMGALDERLIALSEEDSRKAREAGNRSARRTKDRKQRKRAKIYRFAAVAMTTAAAVFILLTARDLIGGRKYSERAAQNAEFSADNSETDAMQDTLAGAAEENGAKEVGTDQKGGAADADNAAKFRAAQDLSPESEAPDRAAGAAPEEAVGPAEAAAEEAAADSRGVKAGEDETAADDEGAAGEAGQNTGKTAVDLLGDKKGDYVKLEYISAEDRAKGGERKEPKYTEERERALTAALEDGEKYASILVRKGAPIYYVYLTDSSGKEDIVTFYENRFVGISTIPAVVMKISDESFDAVKEVFE